VPTDRAFGGQQPIEPGEIVLDVSIEDRTNGHYESLDGDESCATCRSSDRGTWLGENLSHARQISNERRKRQRITVNSCVSSERAELTDLTLD
jgi:hypothetical protein